MKTKRFATAFDSEMVPDKSDQAAGFVSKMMVSKEGFCSVYISRLH